MTFKYTVIVPKKYVPECRDLQASLLDLFNGVTRTICTGFWRDDEGKLISDYNMKYECIGKPNPSERERNAQYDDVVGLCRAFRKATDESCVYLERSETSLELVV